MAVMGVKNAPPVLISAMRPDDIVGVCAVEQASAHGNPWGFDVFAEELKKSWARIEVLRDSADPECILGFCNYWLVQDEIHLLNLAVAENMRRRGFGRLLANHLIAVGKQNGIERILLEVRVSNLPARKLYESMGFETVRRRKQYYAEDREDALVMQLEIGKQMSAFVSDEATRERSLSV